MCGSVMLDNLVTLLMGSHVKARAVTSFQVLTFAIAVWKLI